MINNNLKPLLPPLPKDYFRDKESSISFKGKKKGIGPFISIKNLNEDKENPIPSIIFGIKGSF